MLMELTAFSFSCLHLTLNLTGVTNQFVDLSFDPASKLATCFFLNQPKSANEMTCSIVYGVPGETCTMFSCQNSRSSSNKVYLGFSEANLLQSREEYCFVATASNGTLTVLVEGFMLTTGTSLCHVHMSCLLKWFYSIIL